MISRTRATAPGWWPGRSPRDTSTTDPFLPRFGPEPDPPKLPLDERRRLVSDRVSLHPSLLRHEVVSDDGGYVGCNQDSTVRAPDVGDHGDHGGEPGGVVHRE